MIQFKEKAWTDGRTEGWMEGQTEGWKDGQTLFYRTLLATAGGPIITLEKKYKLIFCGKNVGPNHCFLKKNSSNLFVHI